VVERGRLGGARRAGVVMNCDGVHELGLQVLAERSCVPFDQAQAELDVAEQTSLRGRRKDRRRPELERAPEIVTERGGEQQIGA